MMAKHPVWYVNATRRTLLSVAAAWANPDDAFARAWLEPSELGLYLAMDPRDRQHATEVAKRLRSREPHASGRLIAAALLHDVGKSALPFRVWERVLAHLLPTSPYPAEPRLQGLAGARQIKRYHHQYGAQMISEVGGREAVARLVGAHQGPSSDPEVALLRHIDDDT